MGPTEPPPNGTAPPTQQPQTQQQPQTNIQHGDSAGLFSLTSSQIAVVVAALASALVLTRAVFTSPWVTIVGVAVIVVAVAIMIPQSVQGSDRFAFLANTFAAFSADPLFAELELLQPSEKSDWIRHLNDTTRVTKSAAKAEFWLESGLSEQATILHFSRLAVNLIAIGAPSDLIRRAYQAAVDEIGHAQLSFGLAEEFDLEGRKFAPGTFDGAEERHAFVEHSLDHVCLQNLGGAGTAETLSLFHVAMSLAGNYLEQREREVLEIVLREETQHILLAWDIVHWCAEAKAKRSPNEVEAFKQSLKNVAYAAVKQLLEKFEGTAAMIETERFVRTALPLAFGEKNQKTVSDSDSATPLAALRQLLTTEFTASCAE